MKIKELSPENRPRERLGYLEKDVLAGRVAVYRRAHMQ
jgi:hypothetical protein